MHLFALWHLVYSYIFHISSVSVCRNSLRSENSQAAMFWHIMNTEMHYVIYFVHVLHLVQLFSYILSIFRKEAYFVLSFQHSIEM